MVLGAGPGLAEVLRVLREDHIRPTAIVSIAYDAEQTGPTEDLIARTAVDDLRSSLEALAAEDGALLRAIRRPLTIEKIGRQRLGNLVIDSIAHGFGDYARASVWLGEQLGVAGSVLPATVSPVRCPLEGGNGVRLDDSLRSPRAAVVAIERAELVLLAPGSLYRSVIATAAVPDLARALSTTAARVLWIPSSDVEAGELGDPRESEPGERGEPNRIAELELLRTHGIRVDGVLHGSGGSAPGDPIRLRRALANLVPKPGPAAAWSPT